ncbi:MAG TPA: TIM barrel protein [Verrucomicrobiales bacterium]|nr:TIM barrel protein [Verrucomicrobiales bacterium]
MKLGIGSYTYTWAVGVPGQMPARPMTALDLCRRAEALGVGVVQLCENIMLGEEERRELKEWTWGRSRFQIEFGIRGLDAAALLDTAKMAARHGSSFVRLVLDSKGHEPSPGEVIDWLGEFAKTLPDGISVAIENHDRFNAETLLRIVQTIPRTGITLDTVNSFGALEGPQHVVETLAPHVLSLHIKDFVVRRVPSQMGFVIEGCPAGEGRLDIPWLLDCIRNAGRDPNAIIELWTPPADTLEETIAREAEWAKRSVEYLRTLLTD